MQDIVENIDAARSYVGDMSVDAFKADRKTVDTCERCLQRITEAVIKIGKDRMEEIAPTIKAHAIRGLGNTLRHDYDSIDLGYIHSTIVHDLPPLRAACVAALKPQP